MLRPCLNVQIESVQKIGRENLSKIKLCDWPNKLDTTSWQVLNTTESVGWTDSYVTKERKDISCYIPLKSPDGPAHAGCASGGTYGSSTTNRKSRSPSRPEWLRRRQSRPSCMDAVRGPFARNTTSNSAPYTTESCFVSSGHSARDQTIG